ncbi:ABC transporter permease [Parasulfitobacter algicola]|uniref:ABC transporter permease subunit n=1 Tax=Parasulfitobacter algicola TaxID=2614809 RepID=A0ABX2IPN0_9RHOB|nr:ABC transporter permease subunit [Sulfitobacter algicola]NSX54842.1 ABC transporter permease subunit [Sulfitobacter algicola]
MIPFLIYVAIFIGSFFAVKAIAKGMTKTSDFTSLKTVTFGDESAVTPNKVASIISIATIFLLWGAFTGSWLTPIHVPGPFQGEGAFTYTAQTADGTTDDATVSVIVHAVGEPVDAPTVEPGDGFAKNDAMSLAVWRSDLIRVDRNDEVTRDDGATVIAVNGQPIAPGGEVSIDIGSVSMTPKGTLNFEPAKGWQMEPIWLPPPEQVVYRLWNIAKDGYRNFTLFEHLGYSLFRVVVGFVLGALVGIPLGYAMGLSNWFRGWFDPIVEFMRPVPPLALIPLIIIWFGIGETGKIILLFLASLWIMTISARSGVSGVNISKIHAAYSLGASKAQIMRHVIVPNSLPEIFTGARVAMGVCWGTVVAAELVAAEQGAGQMIVAASKFQLTDIVIMGIILIGIIGFGIDILMRWGERVLVPWKGKS